MDVDMNNKNHKTKVFDMTSLLGLKSAGKDWDY